MKAAHPFGNILLDMHAKASLSMMEYGISKLSAEIH
jgi:hypothetical protein